MSGLLATHNNTDMAAFFVAVTLLISRENMFTGVGTLLNPTYNAVTTVLIQLAIHASNRQMKFLHTVWQKPKTLNNVKQGNPTF